MPDFNVPEVLLLVALAVIIFGPERLPDLARKAARIVQFLGKIGSDARAQLREELGPEFDDIRLADLNPRTFVSRHILSGDEITDLRTIRDDALATGQLVRETVATASDTTTPVAPARVLFDPEAT